MSKPYLGVPWSSCSCASSASYSLPSSVALITCKHAVTYESSVTDVCVSPYDRQQLIPMARRPDRRLQSCLELPPALRARLAAGAAAESVPTGADWTRIYRGIAQLGTMLSRKWGVCGGRGPLRTELVCH